MHATEAHTLPQLICFTLQLLHALRGCCKLLASYSYTARVFSCQHTDLHVSSIMGTTARR